MLERSVSLLKSFIGICLYEFMCGFVPFAEDADDPYEIYEEIIKKDIQFPAYMKDAGAKLFMAQLLNKIPEIRLGGSYNALKANQWFKAFDWVRRTRASALRIC